MDVLIDAAMLGDVKGACTPLPVCPQRPRLARATHPSTLLRRALTGSRASRAGNPSADAGSSRGGRRGHALRGPRRDRRHLPQRVQKRLRRRSAAPPAAGATRRSAAPSTALASRHARPARVRAARLVPSPVSCRRVCTSYVVQPTGTGRREVCVACPYVRSRSILQTPCQGWPQPDPPRLR